MSERPDPLPPASFRHAPAFARLLAWIGEEAAAHGWEVNIAMESGGGGGESLTFSASKPKAEG